MEITFDKMILRDMVESDIDDYVRWFTTETQWSETDSPWEPVSGDAAEERASWTEYYESVKEMPEDVLRWKFEIDWNGRHVGWVCSYMIDEKFEWISTDDIKEGQKVYHAIGIDICESDVWGNGVGSTALRAFIKYYFENGIDAIYTQTWSGNVRMIRCGKKLGFVECNRYENKREVNGTLYDALTYRLERWTDPCPQTNERLERLCGRNGISLNIHTTDDPDEPKVQTGEKNGVHTITLNTAKISAEEYDAYAGYHVGTILLPKLVLETERLILRRYRDEDAEACFAFLSNEQDAYMDCCRAFAAMDEEFYERVKLFGERETQYMITLKDRGEVIGTVNVFADDARAVDAKEIGYGIAPAHQRKGYAYEALSALLDLLQKELCLEMVTAGILPENVASEKLLAKLGFCKEGLRHKAVWHEGLDKPVDLVYYYRDRD